MVVSSDIANYAGLLRNRATLSAFTEDSEASLTDAFGGVVLDILIEAGEAVNPTIAHFKIRGAHASGFEMDEDSSELTLYVTHFTADDSQTINYTEIVRYFQRAVGFIELSVDGLWQRLEDSSDAWEMARDMATNFSKVRRIRLVLLTNAVSTAKVLPIVAPVRGRPVVTAVWDLDRLYKLESSGRTQEPIHVDLVELWGRSVPCLGPYEANGVYEAYLLAIPGELLARIYDVYGPRLLELNVRSFLQTRGAVNRGLQDTIRDEPGRFLAYNNGVSLTASSVNISRTSADVGAINSISNLQIVNGGQTTASLHYAYSKKNMDLSLVRVQAKLSVVAHDEAVGLVPLISRYANSQNKVNSADFTANNPFHVEIERLSRTVWAPPGDGGSQLTRWFYERARGQYADSYASCKTRVRQREFRKVHPLNQKITKTDLAKYEMSWRRMPWIVALGAEKCFKAYMSDIDPVASAVPDVTTFRDMVCRAIIFRKTESLVKSLMLGGYRSQTVTYVVALISLRKSRFVNFELIWRGQDISADFDDWIRNLAPVVHTLLIAGAKNQNVGEFSKSEACWRHVQNSIDFEF